MRRNRLALMTMPMAGYANQDPFTAGMQGQVAAWNNQPQSPTVAGGAVVPNPAPASPQAYQQQPPHPDQGGSFSPPAGMQPTADGGSSPLDQSYNAIYNNNNQQPPQGTQQPAQQPPQGGQPPQQQFDLSNLTPDAIRRAATEGGLDFTQGIPNETLEKLTIDPATGQPRDFMGGILEMMQHMGTNVYANSVANGGRLANTAMQNTVTGLRQDIPKMVGRYNVAQTLSQKGYHKALAPVISDAARNIVQNNPNIAPAEVEKMVDALVTSLGQHVAGQTTPQEEDHPSTDLGSLFNI